MYKRQGENYIRLNYTFPPRNRITEGIRVLCEVIRKLTVSEKEDGALSDGEISPIL